MIKKRLPTLKEIFLKENKADAIESGRYRKAIQLTKSCQNCGYNPKGDGWCQLFDFQTDPKYTCDDWISPSELAEKKFGNYNY